MTIPLEIEQEEIFYLCTALLAMSMTEDYKNIFDRNIDKIYTYLDQEEKDRFDSIMQLQGQNRLMIMDRMTSTVMDIKNEIIANQS